MVGVICKREILGNPGLIIHCFGWAIFFRALFAKKNVTFLALLTQGGAFEQSPARPRPTPLVALIDRCIGLERQAMRIYQLLAARYASRVEVREFFEQLAGQESTHAELLGVCRAAGSWIQGKVRGIEAWEAVVPDTQRLLDEVEASSAHEGKLADVLRLVIRIESSQINGLLASAVEATDARFPRAFRHFRCVVQEHLGYICERIPPLEPSLTRESLRLQEAFPSR